AGRARREEDEEEGPDQFGEAGAQVVVHEALGAMAPAYSNVDAHPCQGGRGRRRHLTTRAGRRTGGDLRGLGRVACGTVWATGCVGCRVSLRGRATNTLARPAAWTHWKRVSNSRRAASGVAALATMTFAAERSGSSCQPGAPAHVAPRRARRSSPCRL